MSRFYFPVPIMRQIIFLGCWFMLLLACCILGDDNAQKRYEYPIGPASGQRYEHLISTKRSELRNIYLSYPDTESQPRFDHWLEYAEPYESNIVHLRRRKKVKMLEIGVQNGGSIFVWKRFFSNLNLTYAGVDMLPKCKQFADPDKHISIEIGSQADVEFMRGVCQRHGPFDFIVDDGGHMTDLIMRSFEILWPSCLTDRAVYAIEDLHAMSIFSNQTYMGKDVYGHFSDLMRKHSGYFRLNSEYKFVAREPDPIAKHIAAMSVYDSMIVLHFRKEWRPLTKIEKGKLRSVW